MSVAFVFPGQGSQSVGMGREWAENFPESRQVFQQVDDTLKQKLSAVMWDGPEDQLNLTENTQPALMAVSIAVFQALVKQGGLRLDQTVSYVAGHSLGEYSALTAAGSLELATAATLLKTRGTAMQKAVPVGVGAMAAILGLDLPDVQAIAMDAARQVNSGQVVEAANDNSSGQVVISGHTAAVAAAIEMASAKGAKRAIQLPVSAPFHCRLMAPAAQTMSFALADTTIRIPVVPVVCNVTARGEDDPAVIRRLLVEQVTGMVRWRESIQWMKAQGVTRIVEIGAGKVLTGLVKRIEPDITAVSLSTPADLDGVIAALKAV